MYKFTIDIHTTGERFEAEGDDPTDAFINAVMELIKKHPDKTKHIQIRINQIPKDTNERRKHRP